MCFAFGSSATAAGDLCDQGLLLAGLQVGMYLLLLLHLASKYNQLRMPSIDFYLFGAHEG